MKRKDKKRKGRREEKLGMERFERSDVGKGRKE